jgi:hypothetical protein
VAAELRGLWPRDATAELGVITMNENGAMREFVEELFNDGPTIRLISQARTRTDVGELIAVGAGALGVGGLALAIAGLCLARILLAHDECPATCSCFAHVMATG